MKNVFIILFLITTTLIYSKQIVGEYLYEYGDSESYVDAKGKCVDYAKKNAVESFATYIKSETEVKDFMTTKASIYSKSIGLIRNVKVIDENRDDTNKTVFIRISGEINESEVLEAVKNKTINESESIKNSELYYYGEGTHSNRRKADKQAIDHLVAHIAEDLQYKFADILSPDEDLNEFTMSIINTYKTSFSTCQKKVKEEKKTTVLRYIKKKELSKIFAPRIKKINDFVDMGIRAEKELRINDALRYYYWSLSLLRSHPDHNKITSKIFNNQLLILSLPEKLNSIFSYLSFDINNIRVNNNSKNILLDVTYKKEKIHSIDLQYFLGDDWSNSTNCKRGLCYVELVKSKALKVKDLKINIEYRYDDKSKIDIELRQAIENVTQVVFSNSTFIVDLDNDGIDVVKDDTSTNVEITPFKNNDNNTKMNKLTSCNSIIVKIIDAIKKKKYDSVKKYFTEGGFDAFEKIIKYGNAKLLTDNISLKSGVLNDEIIIRSIPMKFSFPSNNWDTVENIVFTFNKNVQIDAVSFAISDIAIKSILSKPDKFATIEDKLQLIQFIEYYKTAYCLKQHDYIKSIFADNALIIVGKILQQGNAIGEMYEKLGNDQVEYIKMSKQEYLENLELVFKSNEFINIQFEESIVKRVNKKGKIYGIQIAQAYYSKNYADQGYLFLMMDLSDIKKPMIYVRSWQPEKNPDGSIMGLSDFKL